MYLVIKNNSTTKSHTLTSNYAKPYLHVGNSVLPLTTKTTQGMQLKVKINNNTYRPLEYKSVSKQSNYNSSNVDGANLSNTTALVRSSLVSNQPLYTQTPYSYQPLYTTYVYSNKPLTTSYISKSWYDTVTVTYTASRKSTLQTVMKRVSITFYSNTLGATKSSVIYGTTKSSHRTNENGGREFASYTYSGKNMAANSSDYMANIIGNKGSTLWSKTMVYVVYTKSGSANGSTTRSSKYNTNSTKLGNLHNEYGTKVYSYQPLYSNSIYNYKTLYTTTVYGYNPVTTASTYGYSGISSSSYSENEWI